MPAKIDITGQRFGRLVALDSMAERKNGKIVWKCLCDCGNFVFIRLDSLKSNVTKSCGCLRKEKTILHNQMKMTDVTGKRFGRLTVLRLSEKKYSYCGVVWECKCDCGGVAFVAGSSLKRKTGTLTCGCLQDASRFTRNTNIDPMDVPFEITDIMKTRRELKKVIKQAS